MILFENSVMKLDYNPATDILDVAYPDLHDYMLPEIKHSINILVDMIKSYDVKKLLLDSTRTVVAVSNAESRAVTVYLAGGIMQTRVQKVARVESASKSVEAIAEGNIRHIRESQQLPFQLQNFTSKHEAVDWLIAR
jgi:hypothetical protein